MAAQSSAKGVWHCTLDIISSFTGITLDAWLHSFCKSSSKMVHVFVLLLPSCFSCTVWALSAVLDCLKSGLLVVSISEGQFLMNRHSPKWINVRLIFVYYSPFYFLASTQNRIGMLFSWCYSFKLAVYFLSFQILFNPPTAAFAALFVFFPSLLATSVSMSSSITFANRVPLSTPPRGVAIAVYALNYSIVSVVNWRLPHNLYCCLLE